MAEGAGKFQKLAEQKYKKEQEAAGAAAKDATTMADIMQDEKRKALFGEMLSRDPDPKAAALAERFVSETLRPEDTKEIKPQREKFAERMEQAKELLEMLTPEAISMASAASPELKKITAESGPEAVRSVLEAHAERLAVENEKEFSILGKRLAELRRHQEEGNKIHDRVEKMAGQFRVAGKEFEDALAMEDGIEKEEQLRDILRSRRLVSGWTKAGREAQMGQRIVEIMSTTEMTDLKQALKDLNERRKYLGNALAMSLTRNKSAWKAIAGVMSGKEVGEAVDPDAGMTLEGAQELLATDKKTLQGEYDAFKTEHANDPAFTSLTHWRQQQRMFEDYYYDKKVPKQRGWFTTAKKMYRATMDVLNY